MSRPSTAPAPLSEVCLLGVLPAALQAAMAQHATAPPAASPLSSTGTAPHRPKLTSSLTGVSESSDASTPALGVSSDAALCITDHSAQLRWTARVRLASATDPVVPEGPVLIIDADTWRATPVVAPAPPAQESPSEPKGRAAVDGVTRAPVAAPPRTLPSSPPPCPAQESASPTAAPASLACSRSFHFAKDGRLRTAAQEIPASERMNLAELLLYAGAAGTYDGEAAVAARLVGSLLQDTAHFLAPAPRTLREVLRYILYGGAPSATAAAPLASPSLSLPLHVCPRSEQYREAFSLSDVRHVAELLCSASATTAGQSLSLSGVGFCFVDVNRYESRVDSQRAANRAYPLLAQLMERAPTVVASGAGEGSGGVDAAVIDVAGVAGGADRVRAYATCPLVYTHLRLSVIAARLRDMELLVDRDTVLAVKSRGGGIMHGLGQRGQRPEAHVPAEKDDDEEAENLFRDGSDNDADPEEHDRRVGERERRAAPKPVRPYTTLHDVPVPWQRGDLRAVLPEEAIPPLVRRLLGAASPLASDDADGGTAGGPAKRARREAGTLAAPVSGHELPALAVTDAVGYADAVRDYAVLQRFTTTAADALHRHREVAREAAAWARRTDPSRLAPALVTEVNAYFAENAAKAQLLAHAATVAGTEAYRLERALRDYVHLTRLGVL